MPPQLTLYDEGPDGTLEPYTPAQTAVQQWLWRCYCDDMAAVVALAGNDPLTVIHNGDLTWGRKHATELVSTREANQYLIAAANLEPWLKLPNLTAMRLSHGTGSHGFQEGTDVALISELLRARYPDSDMGVCRHGLADVDGVTVDYAHHGPPPGSRNWLTGNNLRHYIRSLMTDEVMRGRTPPRVVLRAHYHTYQRETVRVPSGDGEAVTDGIITPAYCGLSEFAQQATRSAYLIGCGLVALEIVDGRLVDIHAMHRTVDLRREEKL
jgi:hypothetical protein